MYPLTSFGTLLLLCLLYSTIGFSQIVDSLLPISTDALELQAETQGVTDLDMEAFQLQLPLNVNTVTEGVLLQLGVLSSQQIQAFLYYRANFGPFISLYELQAIPHFDLATIKALRPYLSSKQHTDDYQAALADLFRTGRRTVQTRWSQSWSKRDNTSALGPPFQLTLRLRHQHGNKLSIGLQAEKDAGEPFFRGANRAGFDFYSMHAYLQNYRHWLKAVALGDYKLSLGQGLLIYQGFSTSKGSVATAIKQADRKLAPHASTGESRFLRGAAFHLQFGNLHWTAFGSLKKLDGAVVADTLGQAFSRNFSESGLHRTASELSRKGKIRQSILGQQIEWKSANWMVGTNILWANFRLPIVPTAAPYNRYHFRGNTQLGLSVHYSFRPKNWQLFGEVARSRNGAYAHLHSLLVGLGPKLDLALSYRHYAKAYQAMFANAFRSSTRTQNETGWYIGIQLRPHRQWTLNAHIDIWQHPWLQFRADRPSLGRAYRLRLNYKRKRQSETYIELRDRIRLENVPNEEEQTNYLVPLRSFQIRWHHNHWVHARLELRSRIDMGFSDSPVHHYQRGFSAFQDVLYRPLGFPLSFTCRFAIFDTGSYQTRYYNYENNLLNSFSIPAYYNRGTRWYFNIRYKATKNWTMEMRVGQTDWINPEDRLDQENKREMSVQLRYQVDTRKRR